MKDSLAMLTNILCRPHHSLQCFCHSGYQTQNAQVEQAKVLLIQAWFYPSIKGIFTTYCLHSKEWWTLLGGDHEELIVRVFEDCRLILKKFFFLLI